MSILNTFLMKICILRIKTMLKKYLVFVVTFIKFLLNCLWIGKQKKIKPVEWFDY